MPAALLPGLLENSVQQCFRFKGDPHLVVSTLFYLGEFKGAGAPAVVDVIQGGHGVAVGFLGDNAVFRAGGDLAEACLVVQGAGIQLDLDPVIGLIDLGQLALHGVGGIGV